MPRVGDDFQQELKSPPMFNRQGNITPNATGRGAPESSEPFVFLKQLRPDGPWVIVAIEPDGPIKAITAHTAEDSHAFVSTHNRQRNLYYSLNPTKPAMIKK